MTSDRGATGYGAGTTTNAFVFRSRPVFANTVGIERLVVIRENGFDGEPHAGLAASALNTAVSDELHTAADGSITRRIKILITDGQQSEPGNAT